MMILTLALSERIGFGHNLVLGYTNLILGSLLVFFGIRSYRENIGGGQISFGRAFAVGILITLVASVCYVVTWEIIYFNFMPDFADKYAAYMIEKARAAGESAQKIQVEATSPPIRPAASPLNTSVPSGVLVRPLLFMLAPYCQTSFAFLNTRNAKVLTNPSFVSSRERLTF